MVFRTALFLIAILLLPGRQVLSQAETVQGSRAPLSATSTTASSSASAGSHFDPVGKSFIDFLWEAKKAFDARDYDRVIQLMNYALTLDLNPDQAATATMNRGSAYALKEEPDRAIQDFDQALKFRPARADAYRNRGLALIKKNALDEALKDFAEAIRLAPDRWQPYENRAGIFMARHDWPEAMKEIEHAIRIDPKASSAYGSRAVIHLRHGDYKKAIADAEKAISLDANTVGAYVTRANCYIRLRRYDDAEHDLQTAAALNPASPGLKFNAIAWVRATCLDPKGRDGKQAIELANRACELTRWKNWHSIDTLAAAYAEAGDFDSAIKYQEQTLNLVENSPPPNMTELRQRLELYQKRQPYRDELKL